MRLGVPKSLPMQLFHMVTIPERLARMQARMRENSGVEPDPVRVIIAPYGLPIHHERHVRRASRNTAMRGVRRVGVLRLRMIGKPLLVARGFDRGIPARAYHNPRCRVRRQYGVD